MTGLLMRHVVDRGALGHVPMGHSPVGRIPTAVGPRDSGRARGAPLATLARIAMDVARDERDDC